MVRIIDCKCLGKVENLIFINSQEVLVEILLMNLILLEKLEKLYLIYIFVYKIEL